jgi:hypothetical protein
MILNHSDVLTIHHRHHHRLYNYVGVLVSLRSRLLARLLLGFVTMIIIITV